MQNGRGVFSITAINIAPSRGLILLQVCMYNSKPTILPPRHQYD